MRKHSTETDDEWVQELGIEIPRRGTIFFVAPVDRRLRLTKKTIEEVFGSRFEIVTSDGLRSLEDFLKGITDRIRDSCFVIVVYVKCKRYKTGETLRLPRDNIPFELGISHGIGIPVLMLLDSDISRKKLKEEFSDIEGKWCEKINVRSRKRMARILRIEYGKLKPRVVEWLVEQWLPSDFQRIPRAKGEEIKRHLRRLAQSVTEI